MQKWVIVLLLLSGIAGVVSAFPPGWSNEISLDSNSGPWNYDLELDAQENLHLVYQQSPTLGSWNQGDIYYRRINANGSLGAATTILASNQTVHFPRIAIDIGGNSHIIWENIENIPISGGFLSFRHITYTKLNAQGTIVIPPTQITANGIDSYEATIGVDDYGNALIFWVDNRDRNGFLTDEIYFSRITPNGTAFPSEVRVTYSTYRGYRPKIVTTSTIAGTKINLFWLEGFYQQIQNKTIFIDMNGGITWTQPTLLPPMNVGFYAVDRDTNANLHVGWDARDVINYPFTNVSYIQLDGNGIPLGAVITNPAPSGYYEFNDLDVDAQNNIHMIWNLIDYNTGEYSNQYVKFNSNALTFLPSLSNDTNTQFTHIKSGSNMQTHLLGIKNFFGYTQGGPTPTRDIIYKRTLPPIQVSGISQVGQTMQFHISSPTNPNANYGSALALSSTPNIQLGNETIPLANDWLLQACLSDPISLGLQNSFGVLDAQGNATVTLHIPPISLANPTPVYFAFASFDTNGIILSVSNALPITLLP